MAPQQTHKQASPPPAPAPSAKKETSLKELVGKNIASAVGILVTVIGIFIGARYASSILGMLSAEYLLWTGISGDGDQY